MSRLSSSTREKLKAASTATLASARAERRATQPAPVEPAAQGADQPSMFTGAETTDVVTQALHAAEAVGRRFHQGRTQLVDRDTEIFDVVQVEVHLRREAACHETSETDVLERRRELERDFVGHRLHHRELFAEPGDLE